MRRLVPQVRSIEKTGEAGTIAFDGIGITSFEINPALIKRGDTVKVLATFVNDSPTDAAQRFEREVNDEVLTAEDVDLKAGEYRGFIHDINTDRLLPGEYEVSLGDHFRNLSITNA